jgi:hypothetical protein
MGRLLDDVNDAATTMLEKQSHQTERSFVVVAVAAIEAILGVLRQEILEEIRMNATIHPFTIGETILLQGRSYEIKNNGKLHRREARLRFESYLLFTLHCLEKAYGLPQELCDDGSKSLIREVTDVRNRLVHPKSVEDMRISKAEIESIRGCINWLYRLLEAKSEAVINLWKDMANTLHIPGGRELAFFEIDESLTDADCI